MCSCLPNSLRGGRHKKTDSELDQEERIRRGIASYENGGPKYTNLIDDGRSIGFFEQPVRVGGSILLCGQRDSHFPYQCMVGPDWFCSVIGT